jgi:hypothetical protein
LLFFIILIRVISGYKSKSVGRRKSIYPTGS